tara:strand:+ start:3118 stop:3789 length:672 start_codon:yes stop_codon:yes gene_type:complete
MSFPIYDYKKDIKNILVTAEIRSRFLHMKAEDNPENLFDKANGHSHDVGYEIFLILQGKVKGLIDGKEGILTKGQLCVAAPNETHAFEVIGDEDVIMYLSVTPHIQPTHTFYNSLGERKPHSFMPNSSYDLTDQLSMPFDKLLDNQVKSTNRLVKKVNDFELLQNNIKDILEENYKDKIKNKKELSKLRNQLWDSMINIYIESMKLAEVWNELAPNISDEKGD